MDAQEEHPLFAGAPCDYAAIAPAGSLIFTAGACPLNAYGEVVGAGNPTLQADVALGNLLAVLRQHGAGPEHLVRTTVYVVGDRSDLSGVWEVIAAGLAPHRPPSTLLGVVAFGYLDQLVEIDGIAALPAE